MVVVGVVVVVDGRVVVVEGVVVVVVVVEGAAVVVGAAVGGAGSRGQEGRIDGEHRHDPVIIRHLHSIAQLHQQVID